jgi:hypothetical protein
MRFATICDPKTEKCVPMEKPSGHVLRDFLLNLLMCQILLSGGNHSHFNRSEIDGMQRASGRWQVVHDHRRQTKEEAQKRNKGRIPADAIEFGLEARQMFG